MVTMPPNTMIMSMASRRPYSHTCSETFLAAIREALSSKAGSDNILAAMAKPLELEFPEDKEMREFVRTNLFVVAKLMLEGHKEIWISRTLSHGLRICIDG